MINTFLSKRRVRALLFVVVGSLAFYSTCLALNFTPPNGGLYFKDPMVGGIAYRAVEVGASAYIDIYYSNKNNYAQMNSAVLNFNYDPSVIENISVQNLCGLTLVPAIIESNKVKVGLLPSNNNPIALGANQALLRVSFHLKQVDANDNKNLGLSWVGTALETNVVVESGQKNEFSDTITPQGTGNDPAVPAVKVKRSYLPIFDGAGSATDPRTGNTLNISWPAGGALAAGNHDNDSGTYNSTDGAATYYSNSQLKHNVYRDAAKVFTSGTAGQASWTNAGLNDMQQYTFQVKAIDDCSPAVNESANTNTFVGTPHDYTAPGASISLRGTKDQEIDLSWGCSDGGDLGGYIVVRKEGALDETQVDAPNIAGASGNANGTTPVDAKASLTGAGWTVVAEGTGTSLNNTGLDNTKKYTYWVYAYDKVGGSPVNQGYNYSPAKLEAVPGAAPDAITNFQALSNVANGITFRWLAAAPPNYAGCKLVYTTEYSDWNALSLTSPEAADKLYTKTGIDTDEVVWEGLDATKTYFFKAFAHNSSSLLWSAPVYAAAVPGGTGGVPTKGELTVNLKTGNNQLGIPFLPPFTLVKNGVSYPNIATLQDLVNAINSNGSDIVVTMFAFYDPETRQLNGVTYDAGGAVKYKNFSFDLAGVSLWAGRGYQVAVSKDVTITIRQIKDFQPSGTTSLTNTINSTGGLTAPR